MIFSKYHYYIRFEKRVFIIIPSEINMSRVSIIYNYLLVWVNFDKYEFKFLDIKRNSIVTILFVSLKDFELWLLNRFYILHRSI